MSAGSDDIVGITGLGARVRVAAEGDERERIAAALREAWSRCLTEVDAAAPLIRVTLTEHTDNTDPDLVAIPDLTGLLQVTTQAVTARLIEQRTGQLVMFHAGAICHPTTGSSLVFVAPGGTGKTTLARFLGTRYGYLSDETAAMTRDGRLLPYPKPLSVRATARTAPPDDTSADPGPHAIKQELSPDRAGLLPAHPEPRLARIVLIRRSGGAATRRQLDRFEAIGDLVPETSALSRLEAGLHQLDELIELTGPVERWDYDEAPDLLPLVEDVVGRAS